MPAHSNVRFKSAQQVFKMFRAQIKFPCSVSESNEHRMVSFARKAVIELAAPLGEARQARQLACPSIADTILVRKIIRAASKGVNGRQRVALLRRDQIRSDGKVFVVLSRQSTALGVGRA